MEFGCPWGLLSLLVWPDIRENIKENALCSVSPVRQGDSISRKIGVLVRVLFLNRTGVVCETIGLLRSIPLKNPVDLWIHSSVLAHSLYQSTLINKVKL